MKRLHTKESYKRGGNPNKVPVLISYAYLRDKDEQTIEEILTDRRLEILIDSGGFSALNAGFEIDMNEYIGFLRRWRPYLFGYMLLDKIGDPVQSAKNLDIMLEAGLEPIPIHVWGDDAKRMDELFELSPLNWVALGGLRRPHRGWAPKSYVKQKMEWADGRNVHWLGYTRKDMVTAFRPYSVDCANPNASVMYGDCHVYTGRGRWEQYYSHRKLASTGKPGNVLSAKARRILKKCGFTEEEFHDPLYWSYSKAIPQTKVISLQLMYNSYIRYSLDLKNVLGVRFFLAIQPENYYNALKPQLEVEGIKG